MKTDLIEQAFLELGSLKEKILPKKKDSTRTVLPKKKESTRTVR